MNFHDHDSVLITPYHDMWKGWWDSLERWWDTPQKPSWTRTMSDDGRLQEHTVLRHPFCDLKHMVRPEQSRYIAESFPKILVVAPLSGHYATLLRDTIYTLSHDHNVYVTDWKNPRDIPLHEGQFGNEDYITWVMTCLRHFKERIHVLAVCQPVVQVLAASALMSESHDPYRPQSIILMGGPVDTRINPTLVNNFAKTYPLTWFKHTLIRPVPDAHPGRGRCVYPGSLQLMGFLALNPQRHADAHVKYLKNLKKGNQAHSAKHRLFYDEYFSVMDMTAEYFLDTIHTVFQQHHLPRGTMQYQNRTIDLRAIQDIELLTLEGENDDISAVGQTYATHALCKTLPSHQKHHYTQKGVGHYGLFSGRKFRTEVMPHIRAITGAFHQNNKI